PGAVGAGDGARLAVEGHDPELVGVLGRPDVARVRHGLAARAGAVAAAHDAGGAGPGHDPVDVLVGVRAVAAGVGHAEGALARRFHAYDGAGRVVHAHDAVLLVLVGVRRGARIRNGEPAVAGQRLARHR